MSEPGSPPGNPDNGRKKKKPEPIKDFSELEAYFNGTEEKKDEPDAAAASAADQDRRPKSEEEKIKPIIDLPDVKAAYRSLSKEVHPDRVQGDTRAEQLLKVLNDIYADVDKQVVVWRGSHNPRDGKKYRLARHVVTGKRKLEDKTVVDDTELEFSPEEISLPDTPEQFLRGYLAYVRGATWDETKRQLAYMPEEVRRQLQRGRGPRSADAADIDAYYTSAPGNEGLTGRFYSEFAQAQKVEDLPEVINRLRAAHHDPKVQRQIMAMAAHRAVGICRDAVEDMDSFDELKSYKKNAEDFFMNGAGKGILFVGALDEVDGRAMTIISEAMKRGKSEELVVVASDIRNYPFEMGNITADPLLTSLDEKARKDLITSMQNRHNISSLEKLKASAEAFVLPSNPQASDAFRSQLLDWITRKQKIIEYREKIGWK